MFRKILHIIAIIMALGLWAATTGGAQSRGPSLTDEPVKGDPGHALSAHAPIEPALLMTVGSVLKKQADREPITLIDVRDRSAFERFRIPGAINMPLYAVRAKTFLHSKPLVLVDEGSQSAQLAAAAAKLRESGFPARVLEGGLKAWRDSGAPLEGDILAMEDLDRISPEDLFARRFDDALVLVDLSRSGRAREDPMFPALLSIDVTVADFDLPTTLKRHLREHPRKGPVVFVIADENGSRYEKLESAMREAGIGTLFYLEGGIDGYRSFVERQLLLSSGGRQRRKTMEKRGDCP